MSIEKARYIQVLKGENKILINSACTNSRPLYFEKSEYLSGNKKTIQEKTKCLFIDMLNGNIKPYSSCGRIYELCEKAKIYVRYISNKNDLFKLEQESDPGFLTDICSYKRGFDLFEADMKYRLNLTDEVHSLILDQIILPEYFDKKILNATERSLHLDLLAEQCAQKILEKEQEFKDKKIIPIKSASCSNIFKGYIVFVTNMGETILSLAENYNHAGLLDNSKKDAILFGPDSSFLFHFLQFDGYDDNSEAHIVERSVNKVEAKNRFEKAKNLLGKMEYKPAISKLPYLDFPYQELGFKLEGDK